MLMVLKKEIKIQIFRPTEVTELWQQVRGEAEPQNGQSEGHLCRQQRHSQVLNKLRGQTLLQQGHVSGDAVRQEYEHADALLHLDLSDLGGEKPQLSQNL